MSSDALDRLRRANPVPQELAALPIEPLLQRLNERVETSRPDVREVEAAGGGPRWLPALGTVVVAIAAVVAVAIAVGAIALIGRPKPATHGAGAPSVASRLIADYGALRQPQTAADRVRVASPLTITRRSQSQQRRWEKFGLGAAVVPSLTRVVQRDGVRVTLFVVRITVAHPQPAAAALDAQRGYWLWARVPGIASARFLGDERPVEGPSGPARVYAVLRAGDTLISIVPDDVARVRWTWPRTFVPATARYEHKASVQTTARDNLALARARRPGTPAVVTWYAADGKPIRTTRIRG